MLENVIKIGVIVEITPMKWRELERMIAENSSIIYVKRAPTNTKLKIVEIKGDLRENVNDKST